MDQNRAFFPLLRISESECFGGQLKYFIVKSQKPIFKNYYIPSVLLARPQYRAGIWIPRLSSEHPDHADGGDDCHMLYQWRGEPTHTTLWQWSLL